MSHETCPECDQPLRLCNCEATEAAKAKDDLSLPYLRAVQAAREGFSEEEWRRADRFLRATITLLGIEGERLSFEGVKAVNALAIELAEEIGYKLP
jgi:hypothetical protein